jgi:hypothetical protein
MKFSSPLIGQNVVKCLHYTPHASSNMILQDIRPCYRMRTSLVSIITAQETLWRILVFA